MYIHIKTACGILIVVLYNLLCPLKNKYPVPERWLVQWKYLADKPDDLRWLPGAHLKTQMYTSVNCWFPMERWEAETGTLQKLTDQLSWSKHTDKRVSLRNKVGEDSPLKVGLWHPHRVYTPVLTFEHKKSFKN